MIDFQNTTKYYIINEGSVSSHDFHEIYVHWRGSNSGEKKKYFNLHFGFKSHDGNTKEDIRHCLQDYHIERVQVLYKNKT